MIYLNLPFATDGAVLRSSKIARNSRRFYVESLPEVGKRVTLRGDEAHHMVNVLRVRVGEGVVLLDGSGREARAELMSASRREAVLEILTVREVDREPSRRLTLACALPRTSRMDFLVEKCCELGVARLMPMVTKRGVVNPAARQENHLRRWKRTTIEAAKQSGRTRLMEVSAAVAYESAVGSAPAAAARMIASPGPEAAGLAQFYARLGLDEEIFVLIGPEGGFTTDELDLAREAGFVPVSLGPRILRIETAALALAAFFLLGEKRR